MNKPNHASGLHAFVTRGPNTGTLLFPHRHEDGMFVVSATKFSRDYTRIADAAGLLDWIEKGFCLRMSNPDAGVRAPSLIEPKAIFRAVQRSI